MTTSAQAAGLEEVRRRVLHRQAFELRRPDMFVGTGIVFAGLALAPLLPLGRQLLGVPVVSSCLWVAAYLTMSAVCFALYKLVGLGSRIYWICEVGETLVFFHGLILLAGSSGSLASVWWVLELLGGVYLGASLGLTNRGDNLVVYTTPLTAVIAYAHLGWVAAAAACGIALFGVAGFLMLARMAETSMRQEAERLELQARVVELERDRERVRIARDLHDSIGADLGAIVQLGQALAATSDPHVLGEGIVRRARRASAEVRAAVWAARDADASVTSLAQEVRQVGSSLVDATGIDFDLEAANDSDLPLPVMVRHHLLLVFQEAMQNALRHAGAKRLRARLALHDGLLELSVADDGPGVPAGALDLGRGLAGMKRRLDALGGELRIGGGPGGLVCARVPLRSAPDPSAERPPDAGRPT